MSSRPQPDGTKHATPATAFPPELWDRFLEFLVNEHTGRVTVHVERGTVRMVETTVFNRAQDRRQAPR